MSKRGSLKLFLLLVILFLFSVFVLPVVLGFPVDKTISGNEPYASNKTIEAVINITNNETLNMSAVNVTDNFDTLKINYTSASVAPDRINYTSGIIIWNNVSSILANTSYLLYVNFTVLREGTAYNNVSINVTFQDSSSSVQEDKLNFTIGDRYEYDNNYQNAKTITTDGTEQFHTFYNSSDGTQDQDWIQFTAALGYHYIIQTRNYSHINFTDTIISLYSSDGTTKLQENDDIESGVVRTSKIVWPANSTGPYYIKIVSWDKAAVGGNYSISVEKQGHLLPYIISPSGNINITKYDSFNVTARLECRDGACRNLNFTLDPKQRKAKLFHKKEIDKILAEEGNIGVIVKFKDGENGKFGIAAAKPQKKDNLKQRKEAIKSKQQKFMSSITKFNAKVVYTVAFNGMAGSVDKEGLEELLENENVEAVYYDRPMTASLSTSVPHINATKVWEMQINSTNITGEGQTVCVLDTGITYGHADFGGNSTFPNDKVIGGYDFINSDNDPADDHGHGSHVAGIIASEDSTYKGVAPDAKLVAVKVLNSGGSGSSSTIISGIDWCVNNKTKYNISVISISIGDPSFGPNLPCDYDSIASSVDSAVDAGITVVIASGNENRGSSSLPGISSPACISNAISVGATSDPADAISSFTNRDWFLDLLAPGASITATDHDNSPSAHRTTGGTSMATPHVAGVAALMQHASMVEFNRLTTPQDIKNRLKITGMEIQDTGNTEFNFSRVDAYDAVMLKGVIPNTIGATPFYTINSNPYNCPSLTDGQNCTFTWWVNATGTGANWEFFVIGESDVELNTSSSLYVTIRETLSCNISFNPSSPPVYGTQVNASCSCANPEASVVLYRNGTDVTSAENNKNTLLSAGQHFYNCTSPETQNYTSSENTSIYTINKNASITSLLLNGTDGNISINQHKYVNITGQVVYPSQGVVQLFRNSSQLSNGTAPHENISLFDDSGTYNITAFYPETQNYTSSSKTHYVTVNDTTPPNISITTPANSSTSTASYNIQLNITTDENATCQYKIDSGNYTSLGTGTSLYGTFSAYENTAHNVTVNCTDNSSNSDVQALSITVNDTTGPNITSSGPSGSSTDTTPTLTAVTDEPALCYYTTSANITNISNMTIFSSTNSTTSTSTLSLSTGSYTYYVNCTDRLDNAMTTIESISFTITSGGGGGGGGGGGCSDECEQGETGCSGLTARVACEYNIQQGCWKWTETACGENAECENGACVEVTCIEDWICSGWSSECIGGIQTRTCEDWSSCGTTTYKPAAEKECEGKTTEKPAEESQKIEKTSEEIEKEASDKAKRFINPEGKKNLTELSVIKTSKTTEMTNKGLEELEDLSAAERVKEKLRYIKEKVKKGELALKKIDVDIRIYTYKDEETGETAHASMITIRATAEKDGEFIEIIHFIPKEIAESADLIKFEQQPEILLNDPVVRWTKTAESAGDMLEIVYYVNKEGRIEELKTVAVTPSEPKMKPLVKQIITAVVILGILTSIMIGGFKIKKRKKKYQIEEKQTEESKKAEGKVDHIKEFMKKLEKL